MNIITADSYAEISGNTLFEPNVCYLYSGIKVKIAHRPTRNEIEVTSIVCYISVVFFRHSVVS